MSDRLNRKDIDELIDCLRKSLLYQTPTPKFAQIGDDTPHHFALKILTEHYGRIMWLINKAGGWTLPPDAKRQILADFESRSKNVVGSHDFSDIITPELFVMHEETKNIPELETFHLAIKKELEVRRTSDRYDA